MKAASDSIGILGGLALLAILLPAVLLKMVWRVARLLGMVIYWRLEEQWLKSHSPMSSRP